MTSLPPSGPPLRFPPPPDSAQAGAPGLKTMSLWGTFEIQTMRAGYMCPYYLTVSPRNFSEFCFFEIHLKFTQK
jgi:hypothetical protein